MFTRSVLGALGARSAMTAATRVAHRPAITAFAQHRSMNTGVPDAEIAAAIPRTYASMSNDVLMIKGCMKDEEALGELLIREIMHVDGVSWEDAQPKFREMQMASKGGLFFKLPYYTGIATAVVGGFITFPLCFSLDTALWFNEAYVTTDVPEDADLETWLEVGAWTWNWMEPPLGQLSFFMLLLNFGRNQMQNIGLKPYTGWLINGHCRKMTNQYSQYNTKIVSDFAAVSFFDGGGAD